MIYLTVKCFSLLLPSVCIHHMALNTFFTSRERSGRDQFLLRRYNNSKVAPPMLFSLIHEQIFPFSMSYKLLCCMPPNISNFPCNISKPHPYTLRCPCQTSMYRLFPLQALIVFQTRSIIITCTRSFHSPVT